MDEDITQLADPDLLIECARVGAAVEVLTEQYLALRTAQPSAVPPRVAIASG